MDIDLQQGLGEIADDAPTAHLAAGDLWRDGVRRRNRRRAAGAVAAAAAVLAVAAGAVVVPQSLDRSTPPVATTQHESALPDRLWSPSPWTRSTEDAGPPGRVAALFWDNTTRRTAWGTGSQGYVAVSGWDGSYRYLDAPGLAEVQQFNAEPSLSPDGRYVAYPGPHLRGRAVTGWRVYDAQTGGVRSYAVADAPLGVAAETPSWTPDSSTLVVSICPLEKLTEESSSCSVTGALVWDVAHDRSRVVASPRWVSVAGSSADRPLVVEGRRVGVLDVGDGATTTLGRVAVPAQGALGAALGPDGHRLTMTSWTSTDSETSIGLFEATVTGGASGPVARTTQRAEVSGTYVKSLAVGDGTAAVWVSGEGGTGRIVTLRAHGRTSTLVRVPKGFTGFVPILASDLTTRPTHAFGEPDQPRDPRLTSLAGIGALAVVGAVLLGWRRRRVRTWARERA